MPVISTVSIAEKVPDKPTCRQLVMGTVAANDLDGQIAQPSDNVVAANMDDGLRVGRNEHL